MVVLVNLIIWIVFCGVVGMFIGGVDGDQDLMMIVVVDLSLIYWLQ